MNLFAQIGTSQNQTGFREEDERHLLFAGHWLQIEYLLFIFVGLRKFDQPVAFAIRMRKPDMNRIFI